MATIKSEDEEENRTIEGEFTAKITTIGSGINLQNISGLTLGGSFNINISGILEYFNTNTISFESISVSDSLEVGNLEFINSSQNADLLDITSRLNDLENNVNISGILEYFNTNTINFDSINVSDSLEVGNLEFINSSQNADLLDISSRLTNLESSFNELSTTNS